MPDPGAPACARCGGAGDRRGWDCWNCVTAELARRGGRVDDAGYVLGTGELVCYERLVERLGLEGWANDGS